jgi:hypothetical protein
MKNNKSCAHGQLPQLAVEDALCCRVLESAQCDARHACLSSRFTPLARL